MEFEGIMKCDEKIREDGITLKCSFTKMHLGDHKFELQDGSGRIATSEALIVIAIAIPLTVLLLWAGTSGIIISAGWFIAVLASIATLICIVSSLSGIGALIQNFSEGRDFKKELQNGHS